VRKLSGEVQKGLVSRCASLTAANIENFKSSYPDFEKDEDNRYPSALLDCTRGVHEVVGESIVGRIFEEAEGLSLVPRVLVYCTNTDRKEFERSVPDCDLDFAFDDKEAAQMMRKNKYDGVIVGFWDAKTKVVGAGKNIHILYFNAGEGENYIVGEHQPDCRRALLALPSFQAEYANKFVFSFMIDKPLKRDPNLYKRFISDRMANELLDFENRVKEILEESITLDVNGNPDHTDLLFYSKLLSIYGIKEQPEPEQPTRTIDGGRLLETIRKKQTKLNPIRTP